VAVLRLGFAFALFAPFFRRRGMAARTLLKLAAIGAIQFGAMYLLYLRAFASLKSYEVVLFTLFTPLYLAIIDAAMERRWRPRYAVAAALAVAGSAAVVWRVAPGGGVARGFALVQLSNICFAAGQLAWRRARAGLPAAIRDTSLFALPFAGALVTTLAVSLFSTDWTALHLSGQQWAALAYLGLLSSGACFFWWNLGATRVNAGTLAVFNNAKVPLGVACSLLIFGESADWPRLLLGGAVMALAVAVAEAK
jgi:drug/metabolite transporter (DMT)-like permease